MIDLIETSILICRVKIAITQMFHQLNNTKHVVKIFNASKLSRIIIFDYQPSISLLEFVRIIVVHLVKLVANVMIKLKCVGKLK